MIGISGASCRCCRASTILNPGCSVVCHFWFQVSYHKIIYSYNSSFSHKTHVFRRWVAAQPRNRFRTSCKKSVARTRICGTFSTDFWRIRRTGRMTQQAHPVRCSDSASSFIGCYGLELLGSHSQVFPTFVNFGCSVQRRSFMN